MTGRKVGGERPRSLFTLNACVCESVDALLCVHVIARTLRTDWGCATACRLACLAVGAIRNRLKLSPFLSVTHSYVCVCVRVCLHALHKYAAQHFMHVLLLA